MTRSDRRDQGDFPTPPAIAAVLAREAFRAHARDEPPPRVLDPACGAGALLLAAGAEWQRLRPDAPGLDLVGVEIDRARAREARAALASLRPGQSRVVASDALGRPRPLRDGAFDVVIANPPFLSPTARRGAIAPDRRAALNARLGGVVRPLTNIAAVFLADAVRLVRVGGTVAMILPAPLLGARDAAGIRAQVREACAIEWMWLDGRGAFDAAVGVCAVVLQKGARQRRSIRTARGPSAAPGAPAAVDPTPGDPGVPWPAGADAPAAPVRQRAWHRNRLVGDLTQPLAGYRRHFYAVAAALREADHRPARPVVTTGLVDPGRITWGQVPARIAGARWAAPVVDPDAVDQAGGVPGWMTRTQGTKVLVATQTRVLEAAVDVAGDVVPGVPVIALPADEQTAWLLAAALTSPTLARLAHDRHRGSALSPDAIKLSGAELAALPLPVVGPWWDRAASHLRAAAAARRADEWRASLEEVAGAMDRAYRVRSPAGDRTWWLERLPPFRGMADSG